MQNRLSVARCCCDCFDCCNGDYPSEYDVDITLANDVCSACASLDGTFTLAKITGCNWRYDSGITLNESCGTGGENPVVRKILLLNIACLNATQYIIALGMDIIRDALDCTGYYDTDSYTWGKTVNVADFNCSTAAAFALDFGTKTSNYYRKNLFSVCVLSTNVSYICDPSADALITAVP